MRASSALRGMAASWLIAGDGETPPLAHGALVLDADERIVALGELTALRAQFPAVSFDEHAAVLVPGLVNAHTHLELCALRGEVPGGRGFVPWVDALLAARQRLQPEQDLEAIEAGVSEMLAAGVVAVGEVSNSLASVAALGSAPLLGRVFHEVFGLRRETAQAMLSAALAERALREPWPQQLGYVLAPHTPYTLHPEMLCELAGRANAAGERTSLHLAEHAAERAFLTQGDGPFPAWLAQRATSPLDWAAPALDSVRHAQARGALGPHVIAVHLADARADELALVAAAKSPVVLCPRSNLHIELKLPPLLEILQAGLRPGLGTDSLASNASLDPLAEARALHQRFPSVSPRTLLAMATGYGADVLGFERVLGRLRVGLSPGVVAFAHGAKPPRDPERWLLQNDKVERSVLSRPAFHTQSLSSEVFA